MSRLVFNQILNEVLSTLRSQIILTDLEKESLYMETMYYFGLIGAVSECEALEKAWKDRHYRRAIAEFIEAWLKRKKERKEVESMIV